jgi:hypothetical protein
VQIRPEIGVGNSTISASGSATSGGSSSNLYLEPGVLVMVPIGIMFVGADVNALILPGVTTPGSLGNASSSSTYTSLSVHAQVGVHF